MAEAGLPATSPSLAQAPETAVRRFAGRFRNVLIAMGLVSGLLNLLSLTGSLFMLQVYDRVMLVGRGPETARISRMLAGARSGSSGVLVLRGEAGVGKSALLEHAVAEADGFTVLSGVGVESESQLAYAALHQILRPAFDQIERLEPLLDRPSSATLSGRPIAHRRRVPVAWVPDHMDDPRLGKGGQQLRYVALDECRLVPPAVRPMRGGPLPPDKGEEMCVGAGAGLQLS